MKLVIDIPEEAYELLKNEGVDWLGAEHILDAVANGTPLPEDHGDLIDVNAIRIIESFDGCRYALEREIRRLPVIIKAEGGDAE